jgi:hypothetical protein
MKESTFEKQTSTLVEGDFVMIELNQKFLLKQWEDKQKMYDPAQVKKGQVQSKPLRLPVKFDPPGFVVGKVSEVLMSLVYLVDAYEENKLEPVKKGYEYREVREINKISEDQYQTSVAHQQKVQK